MAAGTDGEATFEEGYGKASELAVQAMYNGTGAKGGWNGGKGPSWSVQKCMKTKMSCMRGVRWRSARTSSGRKSPVRNQN